MRRGRRPLFAGVLLGLVLLLNLAAVVPAVHLLWHSDHDCNEAECVIVAFASGHAQTTDPVPPVQRPELTPEVVLLEPVLVFVTALDCPPLPGRAPPV